jgi:hypothetical protein
VIEIIKGPGVYAVPPPTTPQPNTQDRRVIAKIERAGVGRNRIEIPSDQRVLT